MTVPTRALLGRLLGGAVGGRCHPRTSVRAEVCRSVTVTPQWPYAKPVYTTSADERAALVALLRTRPAGMSWPELTMAVRECGSATAALNQLDPTQLFTTDDQQQLRDEAMADVLRWEKEGLTFLTILDAAYPSRVRDIHQAPPFLFARGLIRISDPGVSVVGSRDASTRGLQMAASIATAVAREGLTVISGLAAGVDSAAHRAALDADGRTVAMIGTGIEKVYPAANRALQGEIGERGLVLSQF